MLNQDRVSGVFQGPETGSGRSLQIRRELEVLSLTIDAAKKQIESLCARLAPMLSPRPCCDTTNLQGLLAQAQEIAVRAKTQREEAAKKVAPAPKQGTTAPKKGAE